MINQNIFKSYDIRGIYPKELNKDAAFLIGRAFAKHAGAKKIAVGMDSRLSGKDLFDSLAKGITSAGADIIDIGQAPTECLYFAVGGYDEVEAGVMITASHNPKEYNGFKMIKRSGKDIIIVRGKDLFSVVKTFENEKANSEIKGQVFKKDIISDFISHISAFADSSQIKPFSIIVDCSSGVAGQVVSKIGANLPAQIFLLNHNPDGNFPSHSPNPLEAGSADQISEEIIRQKADFGFIFDGDADRIFLVDEKGEMVRADVVLLLLAEYFLKKYPKSAIAYNAICSKAVPEFIEKWQGKPIRTAVGFVNVKEGLMQNNGAMGGELSGHYCFKDNFYMDSGMITLLVLLKVISDSNREVSELASEFSPYAKSAEINFQIEDKGVVLEKIIEKYSDGKQDYLDGITVEYPDWWFNIRPSNTEPLLRLTIEAETPILLDIKKKELTDFMKGPF